MFHSICYLVVSGKRNLSVGKIHEIASALKFSKREREYFEALVLFEQAELPDEKKFYYNRIVNLNSKITGNSIRTGSLLPISRWFVPALIVSLNDFKAFEDEADLDVFIKEFSSEVGMSFSAVREIVKSLQDNNFIRKPNVTEDNKNIHIQVKRQGNEAAIHQYLIEILSRAQDAVPDYYSDPRVKFVAEALPLDEKHLTNFKNDLMSVVDHYKEVARTEFVAPDVFQVVFSFFPVVKIV